MNAVTQIVVADVEKRVIKEGKPDQRTIYDVVDREGTKWTAWERELAEAAWSYKGQSVTAKVKVEQNGKYTNRTLVEIGEVNPMMTQATDSFAPGSATEKVSGALVFDPAPSGSTLTAKDTSIHRQTAVKAVSVLAQAGGMTPAEFWSNVERIVEFFETGRTPYSAEKAQGNASSATSSWDPGPFEEQSNDDIPF